MTASGSSRRAPPPLARAAAVLAVAAVGLAAGLTVTASLRLDGGNGDWRAASEGLSRSGRTAVLDAGRRAVVHFHGLDGRPATIEVTAAARPASTAVRLRLTNGGAPLDVEAGPTPTPVRIALPPGTRDVDLRIDASSLFRISGIALLRSRGAGTMAVALAAPMLGVVVLLLAWDRAPRAAAIAWGLLAALGAAGACP